VETGAGLEDSPCDMLEGKRCRHDRVTPYFNAKTGELSVGDFVICRFDRHCGQTELLLAFQSRGWPHSVQNPLGGPAPHDAENALKDIVCDLNKKQQHSPQRVHFCHHGRSVHWEIVGDAPANQ
jgi:hypothetical protein